MSIKPDQRYRPSLARHRRELPRGMKDHSVVVLRNHTVQQPCPSALKTNTPQHQIEL